MEKYFFGLSFMFFVNCCFSQSIQSNDDYSIDNDVQSIATFATPISTQSQNNNLSLIIVSTDTNSHYFFENQEPLILESRALTQPSTISKNSFNTILLMTDSKNISVANGGKKGLSNTNLIMISESKTATPIEMSASDTPIKTTILIENK